MDDPTTPASDDAGSEADASQSDSPERPDPGSRYPTHVRARRRQIAPSALPAFPEHAADDAPPPHSPFVRRPVSRLQPDLSGRQEVRGSHIGDKHVRVIRQTSEDFDRAGPGHLVATEEANEARGGFGRVYSRIKRRVIGVPLATAQAAHERLSNAKALAILSSDALSSVAYATEEILRVLLVSAGVAAMTRVLPIGAAIIALLLIVGFSYRQTIKAYPHGGGAYSVAKDNLGEIPSLVAAGSLLVSYVLTVSVSIAAAVAAIESALPEIHDLRVVIGVALIGLVTLLNLRGVRESGSIFAIPTYLFIVGMFVMLGIGLVRNALDGFERTPPPAEAGEMAGMGALSLFLLMRAFSSGGAALTGVEAISNGVPVFKPVEWKNARLTLSVMIGILAVTFAGITFLSYQYGAFPMETEQANYQTVVSQIARQVFGGTNAAYYYIQFSTMAILVLAANTAYADFPRLSYIVARDGFLPRQLTFRGDRLSFSTGIVALGVFGAFVLIIFQGETENIIPLYAIGVFTSFTLSQTGMCWRWLRRKEAGWRSGFAINLIGAVATGIVAVIAGVTKFREGAWIVLIVVPLLVLMMRRIHKHYEMARRELAVLTPLDPADIHHTVIVPIANLNRVARQTLAYARSISGNVTALHISDDEDAIEQIKQEWANLGTDIQLLIIESPYRSLIGPLLSYLDEVALQRPNDTVTVVLPEYLARHWWEHLLHNQSALRIKAALLFRPGTVVTSVPYHLERRG
ncbi:MAG: APC family permease [Thermomicrobiales bacterium]|nr:APC family permease [Thermomicrobiales bacterium]